MSKLARIISLLLLVTMLVPCFSSISAYADATDTATAATITVTFNANGGQGAPPALSGEAGSTFAFDQTPPRKGGMIFMGWSLSEEAAYNGDIAYYHYQAHAIHSSVELYAAWAYKVTLNDGTQGWGCEELNLYKYPGKDLELFHHKDDIINNYNMHPGTYGDIGSQMVFVEWNTNQMAIGKGNGTSYHEKYTTNSETTLYCVWGYPTVYQADGGTFPVTGTETQEEFVCGFLYEGVIDSTKYGHFNMPIGDNEPIKPGARLVRNSDGEPYYARVLKDGTIYALETKETGLNIPTFNTQGLSWSDFKMSTTSYYEGGMNYYAVWEPSVTYKANGANGADVVEYMNHSGNTLYSYADYTVKSNIFRKSGSTFLGWNTKPDGTGKTYAAASTISNYGTNEPLVLYAQWSNTAADNNTYTVSFNAMEGYLENDKQSFKIAYGQNFADAIAEMPIPQRVGYIFKGWVNDDTGAELIFDSESYAFHNDTSYSAVWQIHNQHMLEAFKKVANCQEEGYYTTRCLACDHMETLYYDKIPHSFENWVTITNNTATQEGSKARFCANCFTAEMGTIDTVEQIVVAYVNKDEIRKPDDFAYVDVINYLPCFVDNGPGNYPFGGAYFNSINTMRNEARLRNPNIKMVYTVCNRNIVTFESWLKTETTRAQFANNLVGVVTAYDLDGLDFDFEFPQDLTLKDEFVALMAEIRNRLNVISAQTGKQYLLNVATPAAIWANEKYDLAGISPYVDWFNIMNYDLYCGTAVPYSHHHTPPFDNQDPFGHVPPGGSVWGDIELYKSLGVPESKIVSGIGAYSRRFLWVANRNNGLFQPGTCDESNLHYDLLVSNYINKNGYTRYWDDNAKAPYLFNPSNGEFITYDDPQSIKYKCELVVNKGTRGLMVFDYVTCDGAGLFPFIKMNLSTHTHACIPTNVAIKGLTCEENGFEHYYCKICDARVVVKEVFREGHQCNSWTVVTEPTATTKGSMTGTCLFCGCTLTKELEELGYTVTFDPNGGSMVGSTKYNIKYGEHYIDVFGKMPEATMPGYTLTGWYIPELNYTLSVAPTEYYAVNQDVTFVAQWYSGEIEGHEHEYVASVYRAATCTSEGIMNYTCSCGSSYKETIPATGHSLGDWTVVTKPTATTEGEQRKYCAHCDYYESEVIPATGYVEVSILTADANVVSLTNAANIDTIIYAKGSYITVDAIKSAGGIEISADTIKTNAVDNIYSLSMTEAGEYTFWVQLIDGREFFYSIEVTIADDPIEYVPVATVEGAVITISGLSPDVKDIFLANGEYETYTEVNANKIVRLTQNKIQGAYEYSYTVPEKGAYTILIRYNDGSMNLLNLYVNVIEPLFNANGLQLTVINLDGIKVIRTAYGEYKTAAKIKAAEGARAFSAKDVLKGIEEYTIQYRQNGVVTVAVCYLNGYTKIYTVEIQQKVPTMVQNDNIVTFGNLDDLKVIRYAKGEFTTSSQIKNAAGSVAINGKNVTTEFVTVELKSAGTYTFCVQYNDESYNYYTVVVD